MLKVYQGQNATRSCQGYLKLEQEDDDVNICLVDENGEHIQYLAIAEPDGTLCLPKLEREKVEPYGIKVNDANEWETY